MNYKTLIWITLFSIAMGYLESSVVVYLRAILYPDGFSFPVVEINADLAIVEVYRELATMIMLLGAGIIVGRTAVEKFAWFIYCFAVWDVFYYVFLKLILNWPESIMTWDLLFLIPVAWVSPVIAPVIIASTMIVLSLILIRYQSVSSRLKFIEWFFLIAGSLVVVTSFIWDYTRFILSKNSFSFLLSKSGISHLSVIHRIYIPQSFNWFLFFAGEGLIISGIWIIYIRLKKNRPNPHLNRKNDT